jgi:hypothetical protein
MHRRMRRPCGDPAYATHSPASLTALPRSSRCLYDGGHGYASNVTASDELVWAFITAAFHDTAWPPPSAAAAAPTESVSVIDVAPAAVSVVVAPAAVATAVVAATPVATATASITIASSAAADEVTNSADNSRPLLDPRVASQTPLLEALAEVEARAVSELRSGGMLEPNAPTGLPRGHPQVT